MKLSLTLVALAASLVYGILVNFFPTLPLSPEVFLDLVIFVLILLGVEITEPIIRARLVKAGLRGFQK